MEPIGRRAAFDSRRDVASRLLCVRFDASITGFQTRFGSTTTFTWSDVGDCKGNYAVSRCRNGGPAGVDFAACESAVNAATCTDDVLVVPTSCEPPRDGG